MTLQTWFARIVKRTARAAGVRGDLAECERSRLFAGLVSSVVVDERYVQKQQLGHANAEMTRKYQRPPDRSPVAPEGRPEFQGRLGSV